MDILDQVMEIIKESPQYAIWIIVIVFVYKTVIVGSIYGVIKFCVGRLSEAIENVKKANLDIAKAKEMKEYNLISKIDEITIENCQTDLLTQIKRIRSDDSYRYIHQKEVRWLRKAIDNQIELDKTNQEK